MVKLTSRLISTDLPPSRPIFPHLRRSQVMVKLTSRLSTLQRRLRAQLQRTASLGDLVRPAGSPAALALVDDATGAPPSSAADAIADVERCLGTVETSTAELGQDVTASVGLLQVRLAEIDGDWWMID